FYPCHSCAIFSQLSQGGRRSLAVQPQRRAVALHVTLQTVAEKAGVSASTASRALAGSGGVSAETTERVLQIAKELGYVPRKYHRKTKKLQTKNVVVLSNRKHHLLNNPFYSQVVSGIESVLSEHGCQLVYKTLAGDETDDPAAVEAQVAEQDGIILVGYEIDRAHPQHQPAAGSLRAGRQRCLGPARQLRRQRRPGCRPTHGAPSDRPGPPPHRLPRRTGRARIPHAALPGVPAGPGRSGSGRRS